MLAVVRPGWLLPFLLPELRQFARERRPAALAKARQTELDIGELLGIAFAVVAVTALTQYRLGDLTLVSRVAMAGVNFVLALVLMALCAGPFHVRRLRRGLRAQLAAGNADE